MRYNTRCCYAQKAFLCFPPRWRRARQSVVSTIWICAVRRKSTRYLLPLLLLLLDKWDWLLKKNPNARLAIKMRRQERIEGAGRKWTLLFVSTDLGLPPEKAVGGGYELRRKRQFVPSVGRGWNKKIWKKWKKPGPIFFLIYIFYITTVEKCTSKRAWAIIPWYSYTAAVQQ